MTKLEKEVIREELMECVGHYVNDVQLEIHIKEKEKEEFEDKVLDLLYERHDYFHNYLESERKMYNVDRGDYFEYAEELCDYLRDHKPTYLFGLIKNILFDAPIKINKADKEVIIDLWDAINHRMWYHNKF